MMLPLSVAGGAIEVVRYLLGDVDTPRAVLSNGVTDKECANQVCRGLITTTAGRRRWYIARQMSERGGCV